MPAPKSKLSRSPFGRQRHYGAVELAGAGEQVNVNDVVEVTENKQLQETSRRHPVLVQVRLDRKVSAQMQKRDDVHSSHSTVHSRGIHNNNLTATLLFHYTPVLAQINPKRAACTDVVVELVVLLLASCGSVLKTAAKKVSKVRYGSQNVWDFRNFA